MRWHVSVAALLLALKSALFLGSPLLKEGKSVEVTIPAGSHASTFFDKLYDSGRLRSSLFFKVLLHLAPSASRIKAGTYLISDKETPLNAVRRLAAGDVVNDSFTIIPGTTWLDVQPSLKTTPRLTYDFSNINALKKKYQLTHIDGRLLPDTYSYRAYSGVSELLEKSYLAMQSFVQETWDSRDKTLPLKNSLELLTVASIIEKETRVDKERSLVSAVVYNRLAKNMRLQMDTTVIYALGLAYDGKLHKADLRVESPYNTYRYKGLPPTPIAYPSRASIKAAAHPAKVPYLYFVVKSHGLHQFSVTLDEQRVAVKQYLNQLKKRKNNDR